MPHIKFRGIEKEKIVAHSKEIIDGLTEIIKCDRTWFTLEHIDTQYIFDGEFIPGYTFAEIYWFSREQEVKDKAATFLTDILKRINNNNDTTIIFIPLTGVDYYDNGKHF